MSEYTEGSNRLVLIGGMATMGKSASLLPLNNPEGVMYLNAEGKQLPFRSKFKELKIVDPLQVYEAYTYATDPEKGKSFHTVVLDSLTFLMDMYEQQYIVDNPPINAQGKKDTLAGWGNYAMFGRRLFLDHMARCPKNKIVLGHTKEVYNKDEMVRETKVDVKGSLNGKGIEAFFSTVINAKRVDLDTLEGYENKYLNITEEDKINGFKYVFQTRLTKDTAGERIRAPMGMWDLSETYIDNNAQYVIDRLNEYYD